MNTDQIRTAIVEELSAIAPDIDTDSIDEQANLRDEYDMDSMDALNLLAALHKRLNVNIPEADYARMHSLADLVAYLEIRLRD